LKTDVTNPGAGTVGNTYIYHSNVSIDDNIISHSHVRLYTSATTFGSTANGGGISLFAGSSGFTRISTLSTMGSTDVTKTNFSISNNSIFLCKASGNILFGRSNGADVRGGGISFFLGFTAVSFVSANWRVGFVSLLSSSILLSGNALSNCSSSTESDSFAFASSAHGDAVSLFVGATPLNPFLPFENVTVFLFLLQALL
jgi:hypothetical protein